jgi:hypothetical protein
MRQHSNEDEIEVWESLGLGRKSAEAAARGRDGEISLREPATDNQAIRESELMGLPDIQIELDSGAVIDLREAAIALREKKYVRKRKRMPCDACEGTGVDKDGEDCATCDGTGKSPYKESRGSDSPSPDDIRLFESSLGMNRAAATAAARGR